MKYFFWKDPIIFQSYLWWNPSYNKSLILSMFLIKEIKVKVDILCVYFTSYSHIFLNEIIDFWQIYNLAQFRIVFGKKKHNRQKNFRKKYIRCLVLYICGLWRSRKPFLILFIWPDSWFPVNGLLLYFPDTIFTDVILHRLWWRQRQRQRQRLLLFYYATMYIHRLHSSLAIMKM